MEYPDKVNPARARLQRLMHDDESLWALIDGKAAAWTFEQSAFYVAGYCRGWERAKDLDQ